MSNRPCKADAGLFQDERGFIRTTETPVIGLRRFQLPPSPSPPAPPAVPFTSSPIRAVPATMKGGALAMPVATTTEPVIVNSGLNGFTAFFVALRFTVRTPLTLTVEAVSRAMAAERLPVRVREERELPQLP